jgi:putative oxygen-independent coproporphyrinogen III oxidase
MHLYLHIPYCIAKCPYCDFNSIAGREDEFAAYVDALLTEIRRLPAGPYATVFVGGGTPTILPAELIARLGDGLRRHITLAEGYEWTVEANPGSADEDRLRAWVAAGANRISLGVQSTDDRVLRFLGRVHDSAAAERAVGVARSLVPRVSCDLIMGIPGQDAAALDRDLDLYRRHDLEHASVYHLAYEPGTEFHARRSRGELRDIDPELSLTLFHHLWDRLGERGLVPYETSNFARPGQESRHNVAYWTQRDYQAAGAGAVSTVAGVRTTREKHPARYIAAIMGGGDAAWQVERLDAADRLHECWMLGLRLSVGVETARLVALGDDPRRWRSIAQPLIASGLLEDTGSHLRLTRRGRSVQDTITVQLMPDR